MKSGFISMNSSKTIGDFSCSPELQTGYFSNSTGASVTNCRFSSITGIADQDDPKLLVDSGDVPKTEWSGRRFDSQP